MSTTDICPEFTELYKLKAREIAQHIKTPQQAMNFDLNLARMTEFASDITTPIFDDTEQVMFLIALGQGTRSFILEVLSNVPESVKDGYFALMKERTGK